MVAENPRAHPVYKTIMAALRPPERVSCWDWNERHSRMSPRDGEAGGRWRGRRTPYMEHWHRLVTARVQGPRYMADRDPYAHLTDQIWITKGRQVGGSRSFLFSAMGYLVDQAPGPMGFFLPKKEQLQKFSKGRILPIFELTPQLARHLPQTLKGKREDLNKGQWTLDNSHILWKCSSLADELRSDPLRYLIFDEYDNNPLDVQGEGNAIDIALNAMRTFKRGLAIGVTTPTHLESEGWRRLCAGSNERLFFECPGCGAHHEVSAWPRVVVHPDFSEPLALPKAIAQGLTPDQVLVGDLGALQCPNCGNAIRSPERDKVMDRACAADLWVPGEYELNEENPHGRWTGWAEFTDNHELKTIHPPETTKRSGHIPTQLSKFVSLGELVSEEMADLLAKRTDKHAQFINNVLALPQIPESISSGESPDELRERLEDAYEPGVIPDEALRVILTIDQQGNRKSACWFPYVVRAWGIGGKSWLIEEGKVDGWDALEALTLRRWPKGGGRVRPDLICLDGANGVMNPYCQKWAQLDRRRRMILHGRDILNQTVMERTKQKKKGRKNTLLSGVRYFYFRSDTIKTMLADAMDSDGGWLVHADASDEYLASLGSEHMVKMRDRFGRITMRWCKRTIISDNGDEVEREDNHWWDGEAMQIAAAMAVNWHDLKARTGTSKRTYGKAGDALKN